MARLSSEQAAFWLAHWRGLRCWGSALPVAIRERDGWGSEGAVYFISGDVPRELELALGDDEADGYATILHELAHVYHGRHHGPAWRRGYMAAVAEASGVPLADIQRKHGPLRSKQRCDRAARATMERWIRNGRA